MNTNRTTRSRRSSQCNKMSMKSTQMLIDKRFNHRYYTISIMLHVKATKLKGVVVANVLPQSLPFEHKMKQFTLCDILEAMNFPKGKVLKISSQIEEIVMSNDSDGNYGDDPML